MSDTKEKHESSVLTGFSRVGTSLLVCLSIFDGETNIMQNMDAAAATDLGRRLISLAKQLESSK